jgi:hypothetical protein
LKGKTTEINFLKTSCHVCLNVFVESGPEVEVEPAKVHLPEVLAVVHVKEIVQICCPADVVGDRFFIVSTNKTKQGG